MAEVLRVDVAALHHAANSMLDHMDCSRTEHSLHDDELAEAAGGWRGPIGETLSHVATTWAEQRNSLHTKVGQIGAAMGDAVLSYQITDEDAATPIAKSVDLQHVVSIPDLEHWNVAALQQVFAVSQNAGKSLQKLGEGLDGTAAGLTDWMGPASEAWRSEHGKLRTDVTEQEQ